MEASKSLIGRSSGSAVSAGKGSDESMRLSACDWQDRDVNHVAIRREQAGRRSGGFGMLPVKQIADELVYNERGNEVLMIKHLK
jgi:hypothetical protein